MHAAAATAPPISPPAGQLPITATAPLALLHCDRLPADVRGAGAPAQTAASQRQGCPSGHLPAAAPAEPAGLACYAAAAPAVPAGLARCAAAAPAVPTANAGGGVGTAGNDAGGGVHVHAYIVVIGTN
eukprot:scaffold235940_cov15-Tisochrysis_lutea.AAC.2